MNIHLQLIMQTGSSYPPSTLDFVHSNIYIYCMQVIWFCVYIMPKCLRLKNAYSNLHKKQCCDHFHSVLLSFVLFNTLIAQLSQSILSDAIVDYFISLVF